MEPSQKELLAENAELKRRLQEVAEILATLLGEPANSCWESFLDDGQISTLRDLAKMYRHLLTKLPEGAAIVTATGDILFANDRLAEILDLPVARLVGSAMRDFVDEVNRQSLVALFSEAKRGESQGEVLLRDGSGIPVPAYLSCHSLTSEDVPGSLSLVVTNLRERQCREALLLDGKLCQEILFQAEQAIAVCDRSGVIIRASRGLEKLCGQNPLELSIQQVFSLQGEGQGASGLAPLLQGKTLNNIEVKLQRPDGNWVHGLLNGGPLRGERDTGVGFVVFFTDITTLRQAEAEKQGLLDKLRAREQELQVLNEALQERTTKLQVANQEILAAQKALRQSQEDLSRAQAVAHVGSWRLDVQQNKLTWSEENHRIFGIPAGTPLTYETFLNIVHPEDREYVDRMWQAALAGGPYNIDHRIVVGDTVKWVQERVELEFDSQGRLLGGFGTTQDITTRKQAEESLRESEERYRSLVELSPDGILVIADGRYVFANQAAAALFGAATPKVLVGQDVLSLTSDDYREFVSRRIQEVLAGDREIRQEAQILRLDGQVVDVEASAQAISYQGRPAILLILRDISAQKIAEVALRQAYDELEKRVQERTKELQLTVTQLQKEVEERRRVEVELIRQTELVQDLYNRAPCGYHSLDADGTFVQINDTELTWLGYTRDEVVGRLTFHDILSEENKKQFQQSFSVLKEKGWIKDQQYELIRKDGTRLPVLLSATAITDAAGNYVMSRATVYDLTDRIQAEAALAGERQRLLQVLEQLPVYVVLLTPDYRISYANREFGRRFGMVEGGQRCYEFLFQRDTPCKDCPTFQVLETNERLEWEWQGPDGRIYAIFDYPFTDVDGSPLILELGIDITARKQAEAALRESEEKLRYLMSRLLTAQESERKRLATELHDELGHALLTIKLHLRLLEKQLAPEQISLGGEIESMLAYLDKVINDVRRLYQDLSPGDLEELGLTTALSSMIDGFVRLYSNITWSLHLSNIDDIYPLGSQTVIYRIMQEILTNIGKHAKATRVDVLIRREPQGVFFMVADDGQGFDMERVLGVASAESGLGLPALTERVRILGGSLTIWSKPNQGTKISFTIPTPQGESTNDPIYDYIGR